MKPLNPKIKSTAISSDGRQWTPTTLDNLLAELDHITSSCESSDPAILYRGQSNYEWPLDSLFVRSAVQHLFGIPEYYNLSDTVRKSKEFHRVISALLLLKFGKLCKPSDESLSAEKSHDIDPWYESLKNFQQYPEKDFFVKGTFFIDLTSNRDIALYFATYDGKGVNQRIAPTHGAIWVLDAAATGKTLQVKKVEELFVYMNSADHYNAEKTFPLLYHPKVQTFQPRAANQMPIYIAQMDYRWDIADSWVAYENEKKISIFIMLILSQNIKEASARYLKDAGITEELVYPE